MSDEPSFSHIDDKLLPRMVDVGGKQITARRAEARGVVFLPPEIASAIRAGDKGFERGEAELSGPKGPIFRTAIVAGIMAAKRTHELIPLCHPIPLDAVNVDISFLSEQEIEIRATAKATHKTGVEMEALQAVSTAALTVYDMCKALGHGMIVRDIALVSKQGGKRDYGEP